MILPYAARLVCLCFASFFLLHGILGLAVWASAPSATRAGESIAPRTAARILFGLRMLPSVLAAAAVAALCIPSYLRLEGNVAGERVGLWCCAAALLGVAICADSLARGAKALWISTMYSFRCKRGQFAQNRAKGARIVPTDSGFALVALMGLIRPKIVISRAVLGALSADELDSALEHEHAHLKSHDNFKRLLLALAPEIFPFSRGFAALERSWARYREWAADDEAVAGDSRRSLALASALVRIARMGIVTVPPLASSLCAANDELSARVERLLGAPKRVQANRGKGRMLATAATAIAMGCLALALQPFTLHSVHILLERLIR